MIGCDEVDAIVVDHLLPELLDLIGRSQRRGTFGTGAEPLDIGIVQQQIMGTGLARHRVFRFFRGQRRGERRRRS